MAYKPFSSVDEIRALYMREHTSLRRDLHDQLLIYVARTYCAVPEEFHRVALIAEALYRPEDAAKKEPIGHENKPEFVVTYPRDFIIKFTREARNFLKLDNSAKRERLQQNNNRRGAVSERSFVEVSIDYFLAVLNYAETNETEEYGGNINKKGIKGIVDLCDMLETSKVDLSNEFRHAFIEQAKNSILKPEAVKRILAMQD
ncbi:MAG: hypothetical protein AAF387_21510 [Pseudomonadota bacterium]